MKLWAGRVIAGVALCLGSLASAETVGFIEIDGAIGPATAEYLERAIDESDERGHQCLIVRLDTPGGLLDSTKQMVRTIYSSPRPVVIYVGPAGATATSAGCFITMASDVAAMAPGTSIGAAHPVALGGGGGGDSEQGRVMNEKMENHAASYIEAIARKRERNVEWAIESVRHSASVTAEKAHELEVIEVLADDIPDLLRQLDGREVHGRFLATASAGVAAIPMNSRERFFQAIWRPEVMFLLMLVAIYGIIGELSNPGVILPGAIGVTALILALYMGAVLPVNAAGVALIVLAIILFTAEIFTPSFGALTTGGVIAFLLGGFMLFDKAEGLQLSWTVLIPSAFCTAAFFVFIVGAGLKAQLLPVRTGAQLMLGQTAAALTRIDASGGTVFVAGEQWRATSEVPVEAGGAVEITGREGLTLHVTPKPT